MFRKTENYKGTGAAEKKGRIGEGRRAMGVAGVFKKHLPDQFSVAPNSQLGAQ